MENKIVIPVKVLGMIVSALHFWSEREHIPSDHSPREIVECKHVAVVSVMKAAVGEWYPYLFAEIFLTDITFMVFPVFTM